MAENRKEQNVTRDWWLGLPHTVEPKILEWIEKYPGPIGTASHHTIHRT